MIEELPIAPLYLIPSRIADTEPLEVLPLSIKKVVSSIDHFIVENEKTAREFIRRVDPSKAQPHVNFQVYNQYTNESEIANLLKPCAEGYPMGLISDAGMPVIGDPGEELILKAHEFDIRVIPLVGPSSITLALMASGLNGNLFTFHGFLPVDKAGRKKKLALLDKRAAKGETQIFMETPLKNEDLLDDILTVCENDTLLCIASNLTSSNESIDTMTIRNWKDNRPSVHKKPTIFILGSRNV